MVYLSLIEFLLNVLVAVELFFLGFLGIVSSMFLVTTHFEAREIRVGQNKALNKFAFQLTEMRMGKEKKKEED
jgi:hypothetical protein